MKIITISSLTIQQKEEIIELWNAEYPKQIAYTSVEGFEAYLSKLGEPTHFLLIDAEEKIFGWFTIFIRDDAKWFAMIVSASIQGQGYGTRLINHAKAQEIELNGWAADHDRYTKQNGAAYHSPLKFYKKNGFEILPDIRFESDKLSMVKIVWRR